MSPYQCGRARESHGPRIARAFWYVCMQGVRSTTFMFAFLGNRFQSRTVHSGRGHRHFYSRIAGGGPGYALWGGG